MPDGGEFGWYVDSPVEEDSKRSTYLNQELVPFIDNLFPTIGTREARGIMGLSMGGHGALLSAAKNPDLYVSASSLSGILNITQHSHNWHIVDRLGEYDENPDAWTQNSVFHNVEAFKEAGTKILIDCGVDDTRTDGTGAYEDSYQVHTELVKQGIPHIWRAHEGTHSWEYWDRHLRSHLNFHTGAFYPVQEELTWYENIYFKRLGEFAERNMQLQIDGFEKGVSVCLLGSSSMQGWERRRDMLPEEWVVHNRGISGDSVGIRNHDL